MFYTNLEPSMCYSGLCWAEIPENLFVCCGFIFVSENIYMAAFVPNNWRSHDMAHIMEKWNSDRIEVFLRLAVRQLLKLPLTLCCIF